MRTENKWLVPLLVVGLLGFAACDGDNDNDPDTDTSVDTATDDTAGDPSEDSVPDPTEDTSEDSIPDPEVEDVEPETGECTAPPACPTASADHDVVGGPCLSEMDCGGGTYSCYTESVEIYDSEVYVSWAGGTCALVGAGSAGCDPDDPMTCPPGSTCIYLFEQMGSEYYGCLDACSASDTSWVPYDWACGCRQGYACSITGEVCLPGCSNDRECCEVWEDLDDDYQRDEGEVYFDEDCTNYCDGDDDEEWVDDCQARWDCVNNGDASATFNSACLFDSDCPPDARCLNEVYYVDDETGEPYYPGGICVRDACQLVGRGCDPAEEGDCVNLGSSSDPFYMCWAACETGYGPGDPENPCRDDDPENPYTCMPYPSDYWLSPSTNTGLCMAATLSTGTAALNETCTTDDDCPSPLGLGFCAQFIDSPAFCTIYCDETLTEGPAKICGAAPSAGEPAPAACWSGYCLTSCDTPDGPVGSNGCPGSMACFDNGASAYGAYSFSDPDGTPPVGFCFAACTDNAWCQSAYGVPLTCNPTTGQCG